MSVLHLDLVESVEASPYGYQNHLAVKCNLTDMHLIFRMRSKTTREVIQCLLEGPFQHYGIPEMLISDHGPAFRSEEYFLFTTAFGIQTMFTTTSSSHSRGKIESAIKRERSVLRKMTTSLLEENVNLEHLTVITTLALNGTISSLHGYRPSELACGHNFLELPSQPKREVGLVPALIKPKVLKDRKKDMEAIIQIAKRRAIPLSYTHLTLPTKTYV